jgi:hypothetical protein
VIHGSGDGVNKFSGDNDNDNDNNDHIPDNDNKHIIDADSNLISLRNLNLNENSNEDNRSNNNAKKCIENNVHTSSLECWKVMVIASASYQAEVCILYLCMYVYIESMYLCMMMMFI